MRSMTRILEVLLLALVLTASLFGQSSGSIVGTVKDTSGGVLAGASVTAANPSQGVSQTVPTNEEGIFVFPQLPSGTYSVTVELAGFKKTGKSDVILPTASKVNAGEFVLPVGEITETVTVEAEAGRLQIQSESGERSDLVTGTQLRSIGLNGRNIIDLGKNDPWGDFRWCRLGQWSFDSHQYYWQFQHQRNAQHPTRIHRGWRHELQPGQQHRCLGIGEPRRVGGG